MPGSAPAPHAGPGRRVAAGALDLGLLGVLGGVVGWLSWRGGAGAGVVAGGGLATVLLGLCGLVVLLGRGGSTPGRAALGLRVVDERTGGALGVGRAAARTLTPVVVALPTLGLGLAVLAWTALTDPAHRRRGWHDRLVGSVVLDVRPGPVPPALVAEPEPPQLVNLTALRLVPVPVGPPEAVAGRPAVLAHASGATRVPEVLAPHEAPREAPSEAVPSRWRVTFDTGAALAVEGPVLVGRRPEPRPGETVAELVALPEDDLSVSKTHARLARTADGGLVVTDRGSTNGSVLARGGMVHRLGAGRPTALLDGDVVAFGDRRMSVANEP